MRTLEERINDPKILPKLKKLFEEKWGKETHFQYIDDGNLEYEAITYGNDINGTEMTDEEVVEYVAGYLFDIFDDTNEMEYCCEKCRLNDCSDEYILDRYPDISKQDEYKIVNYCDECQDKYISELKSKDY